jgi:cytochrome c oxidase subunit 2
MLATTAAGTGPSLMHSSRTLALTLGLVASLLPPAVASTSAPPHGVNASVRQAAEEPRTIEVIARRFTFEPATIEAVEGERLRILVKSADGPHGFEIKKFKVSKEIPRGSEPQVIEFTANEAGNFPILCSLFCGDGHEDMKGMLVVAARESPQP